MAQKRRFLDVWIIESNTVYREVPFTVVTDWVQQGRLLGDDRVRPSGTAEWYPIGTSPTFAAYMPKMDQHRAEDQAEALEPVEIDFTWKRPEEDDDDIDMIPLIDVSLVLLIFCMMTTAVTAALLPITTPTARHKNEAVAEDMRLWVGISVKGEKGVQEFDERGPRPWYALGVDKELLVRPTLDINALTRGLQTEIGKAKGKIKIRIQADESLPVEEVKRMTVLLKKVEGTENRKSPGKVQVLMVGEVSEVK